MKCIFILIVLSICIRAEANKVTAREAINSMVFGHRVYVGKNSDDSIFWKYELLKNAKKSIEMSCGYTSGKVFLNVYNILKEKLQTNPLIQIHFMVSQNSGLFTINNQNLLRELAQLYPRNFHYIITGCQWQVIGGKKLYTTENHMKMIIVDEKYFLIGGTNLTDDANQSEIPQNFEVETLSATFLPQAANDQDVVVSGPMAKKLRQEFYQIYELYRTGKSIQDRAGPFYTDITSYKPVAECDKAVINLFENNLDVVHDVKAYAVISGPRFNYHLIGDLYEYYIKSAKSSIELAHLYFFPVDKIYESLIEATTRDVQISLITNGLRLKTVKANISFFLYIFMNRMNYLPMILGKTFRFWQKGDALRAPLKKTSIYEYNRECVLFHKKVLIVDDKFSTVGSYNLGRKSENSDFEVNIFMESKEVAYNLHNIIAMDKENAQLVPLESAIDYHFNFSYNMIETFENTFFDGTILDVRLIQ